MDHIAAFDTLYTNNHIQICKLLLPSLPKDKQYIFAVFIKFWELNYVIKCGKNLLCHPECDSGGSPDYQMLCRDILPYCNQKEAEMIQKILQIFNTLDTVKTISPLLDLMKQMQSSHDGGSSGFSSMPDISSLLTGGDLSGLGISPELFDMLGSFLHTSDFGASAGSNSFEDPGKSSGFHEHDYDDDGTSGFHGHDHDDDGTSGFHEHDFDDDGTSGFHEHDFDDDGTSGFREHDFDDDGTSGFHEHDHDDDGTSGFHEHDHDDDGASGFHEHDFDDDGASGFREHDFDDDGASGFRDIQIDHNAGQDPSFSGKATEDYHRIHSDEAK